MPGFTVKVYKDGKRMVYQTIDKHPVDVQIAALTRYFPCNVSVKPVKKGDQSE